MRRLTRDLERRLEALERQLAGHPERLTPEEQARLSELYGAAAEGRTAGLALTADEAELLEKLRPYTLIYWGMIAEGIISPEGRPGTPAADHDEPV